MSFDLNLKPQGSTISFQQFTEYFANRPNYTLDGTQAWYENEDTDVYFSFDYCSLEEHQEHSEEGEEYYPLSFNMNYIRPNYFVLEAEPEVTALVNEFQLNVHDSQEDYTGEYSREKFCESWCYSNERTLRGMASEGKCGDLSLPIDVQSRHWKYNYGRQRLQEKYGEDLFAPKIWLFKHDGRVVTATMWADGIATLLPKTDYIVVPRSDLAPRKLFIKKDDMAFVPWTELAPLIERVSTGMEGDIYKIEYLDPPAEVAKAISSLPAFKGKLEKLPPSQVLDAELLGPEGT